MRARVCFKKNARFSRRLEMRVLTLRIEYLILVQELLACLVIMPKRDGEPDHVWIKRVLDWNDHPNYELVREKGRVIEKLVWESEEHTRTLKVTPYHANETSERDFILSFVHKDREHGHWFKFEWGIHVSTKKTQILFSYFKEHCNKNMEFFPFPAAKKVGGYCIEEVADLIQLIEDGTFEKMSLIEENRDALTPPYTPSYEPGDPDLY